MRAENLRNKIDTVHSRSYEKKQENRGNQLMPNKSELFIPNHAHQIKTLQSEGTFNSQPDHTEHSFVITENALIEKLGGIRGGLHYHGDGTPRQENSRRSTFSKLEEELSKIQKMKNMYESRHGRSHNKSLINHSTKTAPKDKPLIQNKSHLQHSKSIDKKSISDYDNESEQHLSSSQQQSRSQSRKQHNLKPSNTPSFNKFSKRQGDNGKEKKNSLCKNIYLEEFLENSQSENYHNEKKRVGGQGSEQLCYLDHEFGREEEQFQESHELPDDSKEMRMDSRMVMMEEEKNKPNTSRNPHKSYKNLSRIQFPMEEETPINQSLDEESSCNLDHYITPDIEQLKGKVKPVDVCTSKFNHIVSLSLPRDSLGQVMQMVRKLEERAKKYEQRLDYVERENRELRENQRAFEQRLQVYEGEVRELQGEREARLAIQSMMENKEKEKQQLETMLKDVLYQREKEKLHSKENTYRENNSNNNSNSNSNSNNRLHIRNSSASSIGASKGTSKMKVENLLQKLQIKVDRA